MLISYSILFLNNIFHLLILLLINLFDQMNLIEEVLTYSSDQLLEMTHSHLYILLYLFNNILSSPTINSNQYIRFSKRTGCRQQLSSSSSLDLFEYSSNKSISYKNKSNQMESNQINYKNNIFYRFCFCIMKHSS